MHRTNLFESKYYRGNSTRNKYGMRRNTWQLYSHADAHFGFISLVLPHTVLNASCQLATVSTLYCLDNMISIKKSRIYHLQQNKIDSVFVGSAPRSIYYSFLFKKKQTVPLQLQTVDSQLIVQKVFIQSFNCERWRCKWNRWKCKFEENILSFF